MIATHLTLQTFPFLFIWKESLVTIENIHYCKALFLLIWHSLLMITVRFFSARSDICSVLSQMSVCLRALGTAALMVKYPRTRTFLANLNRIWSFVGCQWTLWSVTLFSRDTCENFAWSINPLVILFWVGHSFWTLARVCLEGDSLLPSSSPWAWLCFVAGSKVQLFFEKRISSEDWKSLFSMWFQEHTFSNSSICYC